MFSCVDKESDSNVNLRVTFLKSLVIISVIYFFSMVFIF